MSTEPEVRKFICVIDTVFQGRTASWHDEDGKPCLFDTKDEAEAEAAECVEPDDDDPDWEPDEPDTVIEVVVTAEKIFDPIDGHVYWEAPAPTPAPRMR